MNDKKHNIEFKKKKFFDYFNCQISSFDFKKKISEDLCIFFSLEILHQLPLFGIEKEKISKFFILEFFETFLFKNEHKKSCLKIQYIPR